MPTIDLITKCYYNSGTNNKNGTATATGTTQEDAKQAARTSASNAANSIGAGTPGNGGSSSTTVLRFGSIYGSASTDIGSPSAFEKSPYWYGSCSWSASRTSTMYQLKLSFTIPSGITAANVSAATLTFKATATETNSKTFYVCAPAPTTEQTDYQKWSTTTIIDKTTYASFNAVQNTSENTYSVSITDVFKQCITNNQGWVTILLPQDTPYGDRYMIVSGTPQITYTLSQTKCTAPTSISFTSVVAPNGTLTISWSGAADGTNNTITGYDVYYKVGSAPTESSYDDTASIVTTSDSGSKDFSISSSAARGSTFYAMVRTKGNAGASFYSDWKSGNGGKVNSLPGTPTVSMNRTRIPSTGGTITFTTSPGSDVDTGQDLSVWWATSANGNKTQVSNNTYTTGDLSAAATYYFWTYDGLEYSSYVSKTIPKNTKPTITSVTMSAYNNTTYLPSTRDGYVKNINGSAVVTKDSAATLTYQWKLQVGSSASATSYGTVTNISTATSLSNIDVTSYGANFNTAYRLALTITDDIGETATGYSSTIFAIPAAPTITVYNRKGNSNASNTNSSHFDDGMRFVYSQNNTGITRQLVYSTSSSFPANSTYTMNISGTEYSDVTLTSLARGTTYYFKIQYTCGTKTATTSATTGYMRAYDLAPTNITITPTSGAIVKPYTHSLFSFNFSHGSNLTSWENSQDVQQYTNTGDNPTGIYSIKLKFSNNSLSVPILSNSSMKNDSGAVQGSIDISAITSSQWKSLIGSSNTPNNSYTIKFEVTVTNGFGQTFVASKDFSVNFIEGLISSGTVTVGIKTGTSTFTSLSSYTSSNRYSLFETQTLRFTISGIRSYADQSITINLRKTNSSGTILGTVSGSAGNWTEVSTRTWEFTSKTIDYIIPTITATANATFYFEILLGNGQSGSNTSDICKYRRIDLSAINPTITAVSETSTDIFNFTYQIADYGGDTTVATGFSTATKQGGYSAITGRFIDCATINGTYKNMGSANIDLKGKGTGNLTQTVDDTSSPLTADVLYFGLKINLTLDFVAVNNATPLGTSTYTLSFFNLFTFYRSTPNLLYGKNFFVLNANQPISGVTDQILELHETGSGNTIKNKIYFKDQNTYFAITSNGLEIDCGSW